MDPSVYHDVLEVLQEELVGPDLKSSIEIQLRQKDSAAEILRSAEKSGCDLIVLGTHGRTGLARLLMGTAACWAAIRARIRSTRILLPAGRGSPPSG